jgi:Zn-dependent protease with chaperone function
MNDKSRVFALLFAAVALACMTSFDAAAQQPPPQQPPPASPWPSAWPTIPGLQFPTPGGAPGPASGGPQPARALLMPLIGPQAWQQEVRLVIQELESTLSPEYQARVRNIPLIIDPNRGDVNAFAGCDDQGSPFIAATEGLLEAIDAISQTQANDELYGTHTYDQYTATVMPHLAQGKGQSAALPLGILPLTTAFDPRRLSRAHEIFDEIAAFTFAHEISHQYLGHTGCANGQAAGPLSAAVQAGQVFLRVAPVFNQPLETAADTYGCNNTLDTGRARRARGLYEWTERGGLTLLDFFLRLERAAGVSAANPLGYVQSHPSPRFRMPVVQGVAQVWRLQHPG